LHFAPLVSAEVRDTLTAVLRPESGAVRAYLEGLARSRFGLPTVDLAFGLAAFRGHLTAVVRSVQEGDDRFTITLAPDQQHGGGIMETATTGYSADDIALLRARRILLDEPLPPPPARQFGSRGDSMLESLVRGLQTSVSVERSPLPGFFRDLRAEPRARALTATKLLAILWLRVTGTVEHVLELDIRAKSPATLAIHFRGERERIYTNREPLVIAVDGTCSVA
jgi:hypothetical protein